MCGKSFVKRIHPLYLLAINPIHIFYEKINKLKQEIKKKKKKNDDINNGQRERERKKKREHEKKPN